VLCGEGRVKKKKGTKRKGDGKRSVFFWGEGEIGKMGGGNLAWIGKWG